MLSVGPIRRLLIVDNLLNGLVKYVKLLRTVVHLEDLGTRVLWTESVGLILVS